MVLLIEQFWDFPQPFYCKPLYESKFCCPDFCFYTVKILFRNITFHHYIASLLDMLQSLLTVSTYNIFTTMFLPIDSCYSREGPNFNY